MNNLDLRGNTMEFKHYRRAHVHTMYIDLYIRDGICQNWAIPFNICTPPIEGSPHNPLWI